MKKILNIAVLCATVVGAAATVNAADIRVDMYGASAQRDYWNYLGETFMKAPLVNPYDPVTQPVEYANFRPGMGCTSAHKGQAQKSNGTWNADWSVVKGESCAAASGDDVYITYHAVNSVEGILAAKELSTLDAANDFGGCGAASNWKKRQTVDIDTNCDLSLTWPNIGLCSAKECVDIEVGTSDVEPSSFVQISYGGKNGEVDTTSTYVDMNDPAYDAAKDLTGLTGDQPTVVPFAFFINKNADASITNLSRLQAINLFAGNVKSWGQLFPAAYSGASDKGVQLCLRHAGSGTHSTLDKAVFRDDTLHGTLKWDEADNNTPTLSPEAWFYLSSSSMETCITGNGGDTTGNYIAIGYMDADKESNGKTRILNYNGYSATAGNIANGAYDFWSKQNTYYLTDGTENKATVEKMLTFAKHNVPTERATWWVAVEDLKVTKVTDNDMPY